MVVAAQRIGEPPVDGGSVTFLPECHHHQLVGGFGAAHVDEIAALEVANQHRAASPRHGESCGARESNPGGDLGLGLERAADALAKALSSVVGYGDQHGA